MISTWSLGVDESGFNTFFFPSVIWHNPKYKCGLIQNPKWKHLYAPMCNKQVVYKIVFVEEDEYVRGVYVCSKRLQQVKEKRLESNKS